MHGLVTIIISFVLLVSTLSLKSNAQESPHQELIAAMDAGQGTGPNRLSDGLPQKGKLTLKSGLYKLVVLPQSAYTVSETYYKDSLNGSPSGANGTVILTAQARQTLRDKTCKGDPWIGTAHGGEIVHAVTCIVDGKKRTLTTDGEIRGKRIVIEKLHTLYKFKGRATLILTPDGIEERQELEAMEEFSDLHYLYFFMHPWVSSTRTWLASYPGGSEEFSEFGENRSLVLSRADNDDAAKYQPRWFAQDAPELEIGILQYAPKPIPGSTLIQVRDNYHKHYTVLPVRHRSFKKGDTLDYSIRVKVIPEDTGDWIATRKAVARMVNR